MRNTLFILLLPLYVFLTVANLSAQQTFPIYVTPSLTPPYSLTLSDYSQIGSQRLVVTIQVRDVTITNLPVRLYLKMETMSGVTIETIPNIAVVPIYLTGGEGLVLFGDDMRDYFNINNLQFKGYSKDEYRRTGQLPEGFYRFTVEVHHFDTGRLISNQGTAIAWIALGKPPMLKTPDNGAEMGQITGMPMTFSWIPSSVGIPNVVTQYTFEMWEMRVPGIPPAVVAASMPVFYSTTQMNTVLSIIPTTLMLEPGMNYAWRVTASDAMGQVHFAQDGRSEVRTFVYQCRCDSVTNFRVERLGQDVTYRWTPADNHSSFNVEIENPVNKWSKSERVFDAKYLFKSDPDKTYRMRVQAICKGNEMNPSDFTAWQTVVIPPIKTHEEICPDCECGKAFPDRPLTNFTLRTDLQPGDTVETQNGGTRLIIKTVNKQSENTYNGLIWFWWEYYGVKILCKYWDLQVNTDNWILPGYGLVSVYDPKFLLNVDSVKSYLNQLGDAAATLTTNKTIRDTVKVNVPLEGAYIQNGQLIVLKPDGTEEPYLLGESPNRTLVTGSDGKEYVLTSDGKMVGKDEFAETGGNSRLVDNYNKEKEDKAQPSIDFSASPQQQWGFDAYRDKDNKEIKSAIQNEYPELQPGSGYRPSFKSLASFKLDKVLTNGNSNITYRTEMGIAPIQTDNTLTVRGGSDGDETILYAYNKKDTTETVVGKLNLLSFNEQTKKVYIVSVNGADLPKISDLETELNSIYAPAVTKWTVVEGTPLTKIDFANGAQMTHGGSGALTVYNSDQKKIIKAFEDKGKLDKNAYYLFFVENVIDKDGSSDIAGYMPLQYQSGFIYGKNPKNSDIAHELAHGAFSLYHTFSSDRFISAKNTTADLMDYNGGIELWKHQWKEIQNPSNSWFKFLQDEAEGEGIFKSDLSGIFYNDSLLFNNQTLYFAPWIEEKITFSAKKKDDTDLKINWKIEEKSLNENFINLVVDDKFFGNKERIKIEAKDKVIFGKDSLINVYVEKINVDANIIVDSLMFSLKKIKHNLDSLQLELPKHIEENMDILSILEDKYISKGMSKEFETPSNIQEKEIEKILSQMYLLDKLTAEIDNFDDYVAEIVKILDDESKKHTFIQNIQQSIKTIDPFAAKDSLEKQYKELITKNFYEQLNLLIKK